MRVAAATSDKSDAAAKELQATTVDFTRGAIAAAKNLARLFVDSFKKYECGASEEVRAASPRVSAAVFQPMGWIAPEIDHYLF